MISASVMRAALFDLAQVDERRVGRDRDRLRERAHAQLHADDGRLAGGDVDAGLLELLEALKLGGDAILAERQQRRAIEPAFVGDDDAVVAGIEVGDRDGHAGQHGTGFVADDPFDRPIDSGGLRRNGQRRGETEEKGQNQTQHRDGASTRGETRNIAVYRAARPRPADAHRGTSARGRGKFSLAAVCSELGHAGSHPRGVGRAGVTDGCDARCFCAGRPRGDRRRSATPDRSRVDRRRCGVRARAAPMRP